MKIVARTTDLIHDGYGWSENGACVNQVELTLPDGLSDKAIARRIKSALGIQRWRTDTWCGADFVWRGSATMGAYADIVY